MTGTGLAPRALFLHIGLPKTASTWLQEKVFPRLDHLHVRSTPESRLFHAAEDAAVGHRLLSAAFRRAPAVWTHEGDRIFAELLGDRAAWLASGRDALLSEEGIGRHGTQADHLAAGLAACAARARDWGFGRVVAIVLVRRQDRWLASHYAQISDRKPAPSQRDFAESVARVADPERDRYGFGMLLDYATLRDRLARVFEGPDLVVLPHERLLEAPAETTRALLATLRTPPERAEALVGTVCESSANRRSEGDLWHLRPAATRRGRIGRRLGRLAAPGGAGDGTIRLTGDLSERLLAAYADSNRRLAEATGFDLARYGYF